MDENDQELMPPLIAASQYDNDPIVDALLARADIDINKAMSDGVTALMIAAQSDNLSVIEKLLNSGKPINVNAVDDDNKTALDYAYALNQDRSPNKYPIIQRLQAKGAKKVADLNAAGAMAAANALLPAGLTRERSQEVNDALMKTREGKLRVNLMVDMINALPPGQIHIPGTKNEGTAERPRYMTPVEFLFGVVAAIPLDVKKALFDREDFNINELIDGSTPLMKAIRREDYPAIDFLLNHPRIDLNRTIPDRYVLRTALDEAGLQAVTLPLPRRGPMKQLIKELKEKGGKTGAQLAAAGPAAAVPPGAAAGQGVPAAAAAAVVAPPPGAAAGQGVPAAAAVVAPPPGAAAVPPGVPMWQGYSESDLSLVNSMFDIDELGRKKNPYTSEEREALIQTKIQSFSMCPVCLRVVVRSEACMFMTHECSPPYHKELYDKFKYKTQNGKTYIEWCTICGRICKGHKHYDIGKWDEAKPDFTTERAVTNIAAFGADCKKLGGGGMEEKLMRIQRMIDIVCELQRDVGKITEQEARNILTQEIWDSAVEEPDAEVLVAVMEGKKFLLDEHCKSILNKPVGQKETTYADVNRPADQSSLSPVKYDGVTVIPYSAATLALRKIANETSQSSSSKDSAEAAAKAAEDAEKENYCAPELGVHEDNRPTYGFRHKQPNGSILEHGMVKEDGVYTERYCGEHLEELLRNTNIQDTKGKCPLSDACNAKLYPEEIQGIVSNDYYENYKRIFNEVNTGLRGGAAIPPIFGKLTDVQGICALPQKAGKNRTCRAKKARNTRKRV